MAYFLSPILIAHWPYLKMKNFDFFVQNILDGIKILDLNDAGSYQAKPIHEEYQGKASTGVRVKVMNFQNKRKTLKSRDLSD